MKRRNFLKGAVALSVLAASPKLEGRHIATQKDPTPWEGPFVPMTYGCDGWIEPTGKNQHVLFFDQDFIAYSLATHGTAKKEQVSIALSVDHAIFSAFDLLDFREPFELVNPLLFRRGSSLEISIKNKSPYFRSYACFLFGQQFLGVKNDGRTKTQALQHDYVL